MRWYLTGYVISDEGVEEWLLQGLDECCDDEGIAEQITHWQPLPPVPETETETSGQNPHEQGSREQTGTQKGEDVTSPTVEAPEFCAPHTIQRGKP